MNRYLTFIAARLSDPETSRRGSDERAVPDRLPADDRRPALTPAPPPPRVPADRAAPRRPRSRSRSTPLIRRSEP